MKFPLHGQYRRKRARDLEDQARHMQESGQLVSALPISQRASVLYKKLYDEDGLARIYNLQGNIYVGMSDISTAIEHFRQSLHIAQRMKDQKQEEIVLGNMAAAYNQQGDFRQAIAYLEQSLTIARAINDTEGILLGSLNLGNSQFLLGNYDQAINSYLFCLNQFNEPAYTLQKGIVLGSLGEIYHAMADYDNAEKYFTQSLQISRGIADHQGVATALGGLGFTELMRGHYPPAITYFQQALEIAQKFHYVQNEGKLLGYLGTAFYEQGDYESALRYHQERLLLAQRISDQWEEASAWGSIGSVHSDRGEWQEAIRCFQKELAMARAIQAALPEGRALANLGATSWLSGDLAGAETYLWEAVEAWEKLQQVIGPRDVQKVLFMDQQITYWILLMVLVAQNKLVEALVLTERRRTSAFNELVIRQLAANPDSKSSTILPVVSAAELQAIAREQHLTCVEYAFLLRDSRDTSQRQHLEPSELLAWVVQPNGTIHFRRTMLAPFFTNQPDNSIQETLQPEMLVPEATRDARRTRPQTLLTKEKLRSLHQLLIEPILDLLPSQPAEQIVFVPQLELFQVPFAALQDAAGRYFIEQHTLRIAPSIQSLSITQQHYQHAQQINKQSRLVVGISSSREFKLLNQQQWQLSALPYAEQEARSVSQLLGTTPLMDMQATKPHITKLLPEQKMIHLATHGILQDVDQMGVPGAIILSPSDQDNGLLTALELLNIPLNAQLVVLSACNTGRGRVTGEGIFGLPRVLIAAGAASIIVTLWSVPDRSTSFLMEKFYEQLRAASDSAVALREAMRLAMKQFPDPVEWAGFFLIGNAECRL